MADIDNIAYVMAELQRASDSGDTSVSGGGLINTQWQVDNKQQEYAYSPTDLQYTTLFAPTTTSYTIPIITITGSTVSDTGNTSTAQPISYTTSTSQTAKPSVSQSESASSGLTEMVVPIAIIAGIAVVGVTAVNVFGTKSQYTPGRRK